jgi:hypothetical protein
VRKYDSDVGSTYPGAGANVSALLTGNGEVINKLKTVEADSWKNS